MEDTMQGTEEYSALGVASSPPSSSMALALAPLSSPTMAGLSLQLSAAHPFANAHANTKQRQQGDNSNKENKVFQFNVKHVPAIVGAAKDAITASASATAPSPVPFQLPVAAATITTGAAPVVKRSMSAAFAPIPSLASSGLTVHVPVPASLPLSMPLPSPVASSPGALMQDEADIDELDAQTTSRSESNPASSSSPSSVAAITAASVAPVMASPVPLLAAAPVGGCSLLTSNSNLSNSFRKGNGKRCLTRAPLIDGQGNAVADYPHLAPSNNATTTTTVSAAAAAQQASSPVLFPHEPLAHMETSSSSFMAPPPALRPIRMSGGLGMGLALNGIAGGGGRLGGAGSAVPVVHPILTTAAAANRTPEQPLLPLFGAGESSCLRTPTPTDSPVRRQLLSFSSGEKEGAAPSSASSTDSNNGINGGGGGGLNLGSSHRRGAIRNLSASGNSAFQLATPSSAAAAAAAVAAAPRSTSQCSPLPSLESPLPIRCKEKESAGSSSRSNNALGLSAQRSAASALLDTPARLAPDSGASSCASGSSGRLTSRQQAMLASPALTIDFESPIEQQQQQQHPPALIKSFQIRALKGLVMPTAQPPRKAGGHHRTRHQSMAVHATGGGGAMMMLDPSSFASSHCLESALEEQEMARNRAAVLAEQQQRQQQEEEQEEEVHQQAASSAHRTFSAPMALPVPSPIPVDEDDDDTAESLAASQAVAAAVAAHEAALVAAAADAEVERHRPKRARSLAFTSVPLELTRAGSVPPSVLTPPGAATSHKSSSGISPLFNSASLHSYSNSLSMGLRASSAAAGPIAGGGGADLPGRHTPALSLSLSTSSSSSSSSASLPLYCSSAGSCGAPVSLSGRHSMPLLTRTLSCTSGLGTFAVRGSSGGHDDSPIACIDEAMPAADDNEEENEQAPQCEATCNEQLAHSTAAAELEYSRRLLLSSAALAAEDSLLRTLKEASSVSSSSSASSAYPAASASASPRVFASASPPPLALASEAVSPTAAWEEEEHVQSTGGMEVNATLGQFVPSSSSSSASHHHGARPAGLQLAGDDDNDEDEENEQPSGLSSAPVQGTHGGSFSSFFRSSSRPIAAAAAAPLTLGANPSQCNSGLGGVHRRGATTIGSMLDAALLASSSQAGQSSPSTAAAQRAVLMDETEDDAAEHCATVAAAAASSVSASLFQNASLQSTNCSSGGVLPSLSSAHSDVKRISCATMARLLRGDFRSLRAGGSLPDGEGLDNFIIIDCRYAYEYSGGHIDGAINLNDRALLSKFFRVNSTVGAKLAVVFHCEFSQNRAPKSYRFFRSLDRLRNSASYPLLSFPEIAVLDGGYKNFFAHYPDHCEPRAYVSMWDEQFQHECRTETSKHRKSWGTGKCAGQERGGAAGGFGAGGGGSRSRSSRRRSTTTGGLEFEMPLSYPTAAASSAAASSIGLGLGAALAPSPNTGSFPFVRSLSAVNLSNAGLEAISASPAAAATVVGVASPSTSSSSAASGAGADSPGSAPPSAPRRLHGASMFSPMESDSNPASATAASCHLGAGMGADRSPLPSFSLGSAAHSPADAGAPATAAATSAAAPLSFASGSNSAAATPPHSHGLSHALAGVSPLQPLAFRLSLSSPSPKR